jgi:SAM-dependent methyltransferase
MSAPTPYDEAYYREIQASARRSARIVAPLVARLVEPRSVLDVGCGLGTWLAAFVDHGVEDVYGIDGHDIPIRKARVEGGSVQRPGVIRHSELGALGGNHADPGPYDMHAMLSLARFYREKV